MKAKGKYWQKKRFMINCDWRGSTISLHLKSTAGMSSPGGEDLSRLGNGERNLAKPKAVRPNERERVSPTGEGELNTN
jgi:hypothetical protein